MKIRVRDQKQKFQKDVVGDVIITVRRNQNSPRFEGTPYTQTLSENSLLSSSVFTLAAVDDDLRVRFIFLR